MSRQRSARFAVCLTALAIAHALHGGRTASAQQPDAAWVRLQERIEAIEAENRALRSLLERDDDGPVSLRDGIVPVGGEGEADEGLDLDRDERLRSLVRQYVAEEEARLQGEQTASYSEYAAPGGAGPPANPLAMSASWNHGFEAKTADKKFRVHVGGRTQLDTAWFAVDGAVQNDPTILNRYEDGADFRRARLRVDGTMYDQLEFAAEYDFVNSVRTGTFIADVPALTDLWFTFTKLPYLGNVRIGNQKPAIGFEHLVSSRYLPFLERSFNQDTFYGGFFNGFLPGIAAFDTAFDERMTWNVGWYKPTNNVFGYSAASGESQFTGRLTCLPLYEDEGERLIHFGVSGQNSSAVDDRVRYRTRSAIRSGIASIWPVPADIGPIVADTEQIVNTEFAAVCGPLSLQAEYLANWTQGAGRVAGPEVGTVFYQGAYVQVLCFLTGESQPYDRKTGTFGRVIPHESFLCKDEHGCREHGIGAWQVGARYNLLDLDDRGLDGGTLHDVTAGVNWFLNPNAKLQWNYSATYREAASATGDGWIQGFGMRLAHDF